MIKKGLLFLFLIVTIGLLFYNSNNETKTEKLRKKHASFIKNHPFNKTVSLSKKERKAQGLPPNAFFEQEYLNEIDPNTGRVPKEKIYALQKQLENERMGQRVPGDNQNAWASRGPNNVGGRTRAVVFDPNDATNETVYAGGVSGGLWKNTNISNSNSGWVQVGIPENLSVSCIAIDPNNSNIWYVGTGESYVNGGVNGNGVWKTTDGGTTWNHVFGGISGAVSFDSNASVTVNLPVNIAGSYSATLGTAFGGDLSTTIIGDAVLVQDGVGTSEDACSSLTNTADINGKIAVIRRGDCTFVDKIQRAQDAGAVAVIMVNNVAGYPIPMGGSSNSITIPGLMMSKTDGDKIINELNNNNVVSLTLAAENGTGSLVLPGTQHINDIVIRNNNGMSEVYVASGEAFYAGASPSVIMGGNEIGVYKSTDGTTFNRVNMPLTSGGKRYEPNNLTIGADNAIYVSTNTSIAFGDGGGAILKSMDGDIFSLKYTIPNGARTEIEASPSHAGVVYILAELTAGTPVGIYKTTDDFTIVNTLPLPNDADTGIPSTDFTRGQAFYDLLLRVDPNDQNTVYVGGVDLFKTTNGGVSWTQISKWSNNNNLGGLSVSLVHADHHGLAFASSNRMVFGNDGGVYFSDDSGATIQKRNKDYVTGQFYTVAVGPTAVFAGDYFSGGVQDNGTQLFENANPGEDSSVQAQGGDGAYSFFDQDGSDKYYVSNYVYNSGITLFNYQTNSSRTINSESASNGSFINQETLDSNLDILYTNYTSGTTYRIRRYKNIKIGTINKTILSNGLLNSTPITLKTSPFTTVSSTLFVGLLNGKLLKITTANEDPSIFSSGPEWSDITGSDFVGSISDIEFGASENEIFVTMHNYGVQSIWYTTDGGSTWVAKEGDLPDLPVKAILQNPLRSQEVIIGTELGVWRTANFDDASPHWVQSNNGMKNVKVLDLDVRDDNKVFAATYGRGVFSGQFTAEVTSVAEETTDNFSIYPTISDGHFTILAKNTFGKTKMTIFDINGKKVHSKNIDFNQQQKQEVTVNLQAGVYIVNLIGDHQKQTSLKIIIK